MPPQPLYLPDMRCVADALAVPLPLLYIPLDAMRVKVPFSLFTKSLHFAQTLLLYFLHLGYCLPRGPTGTSGKILSDCPDTSAICTGNSEWM